jgi:hypothetical protein
VIAVSATSLSVKSNAPHTLATSLRETDGGAPVAVPADGELPVHAHSVALGPVFVWGSATAAASGLSSAQLEQPSRHSPHR